MAEEKGKVTYESTADEDTDIHQSEQKLLAPLQRDQSISLVAGVDEEGDEEGESAAKILGDILRQSSANGLSGDPALAKKINDGDEDDSDEDESLSSIGSEGSAADADKTSKSILQSTVSLGVETSDSFTRLKIEYDRIYHLYSESKKNEKQLMNKCRDLSNEINFNAIQVSAALKLSQNDRIAITSLKKEVKKAWKIVESSKGNENKSNAIIHSLKKELDTMRKSAAAMTVSMNEEIALASAPVAGAPASHATTTQQAANTSSPAAPTSQTAGENPEFQLNTYSLKNLIQDKYELTKQIQNLQADISVMSKDFNEIKKTLQEVSNEREAEEAKCQKLKDRLTSKVKEVDQLKSILDETETKLVQAIEENKARENEYSGRFREIQLVKDQLSRAEMAVKEERSITERLERDNNQILVEVGSLQNEIEDLQKKVRIESSEKQRLEQECRAWEEDVIRYKDDLKGSNRVKDSYTKKIKFLEEAKIESDLERTTLKSLNQSLTKDLEIALKGEKNTEKELHIITRDRDIAQQNLVRVSSNTQKQTKMVKTAEVVKMNLEHEIASYKEEASKMRKLIFSLERDRDQHIAATHKMERELSKFVDDSKLLEMALLDSKKKIGDLEKKNEEQTAMYESVRADRNLYSKNLVETQDEITELKRKIKIMNHQIEQLKEEISVKEAALVKEHFEYSKIQKEKEGQHFQISKLTTQYDEAQQMIQNQQAEEDKLRHIISEADIERTRQQKEYDQVVQERDILGTQLVRRNDELSLLYEKIKIYSSTLNKGEIQFRERLEDIRVLKLEIKKLRREKAILQTETQNVDHLRTDIFKLQREVLRERTRVKVLEEELESPMNIHRWRKLSGSDPSTYELITKIQALQKRLIRKTEEVVEKELLLKQKEKLYQEVKEMLQRQPGPEVLEEVRNLKDAMKGKIRECKALASELNMYHSQVNEYKYEIEKLAKTGQELKKKYFEHRKKERTEKKFPGDDYTNFGDRLNMDQRFKTNPIQPNVGQNARFAGGGFNMSSVQMISKASSKAELQPKAHSNLVPSADNLSQLPVLPNTPAEALAPVFSAEQTS